MIRTFNPSQNFTKPAGCYQRGISDPNMPVMKEFFDLVAKYGTPEEINQTPQSRKMENLFKKVEASTEYIKDLKWLIEQR